MDFTGPSVHLPDRVDTIELFNYTSKRTYSAIKMDCADLTGFDLSGLNLNNMLFHLIITNLLFHYIYQQSQSAVLSILRVWSIYLISRLGYN